MSISPRVFVSPSPNFSHFFHVSLYLIPNLFVALRISLGVCWGTLVAAELLAAERGLGAVIQNAGNYFKITDIYVGLFCIGAVALTMDAIISKTMGIVVNWQDRVER